MKGAKRHVRRVLKVERARRKKSKTMYNLKQKSKFRIFTAETKRGTVTELEQRRVGRRPLFRAKFENEVLSFFRRRDEGGRGWVPHCGAILQMRVYQCSV